MSQFSSGEKGVPVKWDGILTILILTGTGMIPRNINWENMGRREKCSSPGMGVCWIS